MGKANKAKDADEKGITVKKQDDMPEWYSQVILKAELADYSPIKGCMIIRPYGYAIWEKITDYFNCLIKGAGVKNAYFPMFIPESFFRKEAQHAEGFAPEVAWVERKDDHEERLALRPTSETIMYDAYARWIRSYRDLPLRINQWCNIIRWEVKDVKPFLRSREFLWQEGHCVYETPEERHKETLLYLDFYRKVAMDLLSVPVIMGEKSERERFAGADATYTIEGFMPDGKALQMGTSHDLSQGFAKAFNIRYLGKDEQFHHPYQNSWGISTRMIGAVVMMHGDDKGLVLPPLCAPIPVVIVPILFDETKEAVLAKARELQEELGKDVLIDDRAHLSPGYKFNDWEMKGVPLRIEIGPKDLEKGHVVLARRDTGEKEFVKFPDVKSHVGRLLNTIQEDLLRKAKAFYDSSIIPVTDWDALLSTVKGGKMARASFCGNPACEESIKAESGGITARCQPLDSAKAKGTCFKCGKEAKLDMLFARNY